MACELKDWNLYLQTEIWICRLKYGSADWNLDLQTEIWICRLKYRSGDLLVEEQREALVTPDANFLAELPLPVLQPPPLGLGVLPGQPRRPLLPPRPRSGLQFLLNWPESEGGRVLKMHTNSLVQPMERTMKLEVKVWNAEKMECHLFLLLIIKSVCHPTYCNKNYSPSNEKNQQTIC